MGNQNRSDQQEHADCAQPANASVAEDEWDLDSM